MRPIKFRGRKLKDGKLIFGSYVHTTPMSSFPSIIDDCGFYNEVEPESVAQFVGYDADGNEVYEGDELIDEDGSPINSLYVGIVDSDSNAIDGEIGTRFSDVWIKKERGGNETADF